MTDRTHLVVATPCFGGQLSVIYAQSLLKLQKVLRATPEIEMSVLLRNGDAPDIEKIKSWLEAAQSVKAA